MKPQTPARRLKSLPNERAEVDGPPVAVFVPPTTRTTGSTTEPPVHHCPCCVPTEWLNNCGSINKSKEYSGRDLSCTSIIAQKWSKEVGSVQVKMLPTCGLSTATATAIVSRPSHDQASLASPNQHLEGATSTIGSVILLLRSLQCGQRVRSAEKTANAITS